MAPRTHLALQALAVGVGRHRSIPGPASLPGPPHEGMRRGSPTQRQGRNYLSQLPAGRRGGRHSPRLTQDCVPLAKEGKLPFLKTLGGHRRYPEAEIRELAERLREETTA